MFTIEIKEYSHLLKIFIDEIISKELNLNANISIVENNNLEKDVNGICIDVDKNNFLVAIKTKNRNITQIFTTVAHELVHVKQYIENELSDNLLSLKNEYIEYFDRWWEKEAIEKSNYFLKKFTKYVVDNKLNV